MPQSDQDYASQIATLERKFRLFKRNIVGTAAAGKLALQDAGTIYLFEARLDSASSDLQQLQSAWEQLLNAHANAGTTPSEEWERGYDSSRNELITARSCLKEIQQRRAWESSLNAKADFDTSHPKPIPAAPTKPHLAPIPVPHFTGDWLKWPHFRDTFRSVVHDDPALSDIERLHYLLGALSGEPASLISKLAVEEKSYKLAWRKLNENYENPRVLASILLKRMLEGDPRGSKTELQHYEHFLTHVADSIECFRSLSLEDPAEFLLGSLALKALDPQTRRNFELSRHNSNESPTADDVINFVRQRKTAITMSREFSSLSSASNSNTMRGVTGPKAPRRASPKYYSRSKQDAVNFHVSSENKSTRATTSRSASSPLSKPRRYTPSPKTNSRRKTSRSNDRTQNCPFCQGNHLLSGCIQFIDTPRQNRIEFAHSLKCCQNCLRPGHQTAECRSKWTCRFCNLRHHSLIHAVPTVENQSSTLLSTKTNHSHPNKVNQTLLGTVQVLVEGPGGKLHSVRGVIDSGSQHTFLSLNAAKGIGLPVRPHTSNITGLGGSLLPKPLGFTHCKLRAKGENKGVESQAIVVETITHPLPNFTIPQHKVQRLRKNRLADQSFAMPGAIDLLLGMDLYPSVINGKPYHSGVDNLYFLPTTFGLVVIGSVSDTITTRNLSLITESRVDIQECLKTFWELEEPKTAERENPEDKACEEHFIRTTTRTSDGRYMVRLPLLSEHEPLGGNREVVAKRFFNLERRFKTDHVLSEQYLRFMREYEDLQHFSPATRSSDYLIPHHGVWQRGTVSKKVRVVFDASCPSSTNTSLNSILMTGPKLHSDIGDILTKFRLFQIPLCADLVKMYRQILIHPEDRHLQHILWRTSQDDALVEMELNTVTYGLRSSAYQSLRVIRQLTIDEGEQFPLAVKAVSTSMYVDDIVTGADTVEEALELQKQLTAFFNKGGFTLSKWASTAPELIPREGFVEPLQLNPPESETIKILGLIWNPSNDSFSYYVSAPPICNVTKRIILSAISRIFDPIGLVAPIVLRVKLLLQEIWKCKLDWDQPIPRPVEREWQTITGEWNLIPVFSIPRYISSNAVSHLLVGFCDASNKAYAASIYLRTETLSGDVRSYLIKAKTKVAPVKYTSVARLELCGALLLARLLSTMSIPKLKATMPICYTDSSVVLSWLRIPTYNLKVFEANRISEILTITSPGSWRHVRSEENPSDIASRGCLPSALHGNDLWWHGPPWLCQPMTSWPPPQRFEIQPTSTSSHITCATTLSAPSDSFMTRFSDYNTLVRTTARIIRLMSIVRPPRKKLTGPITAEEFRDAKLRCARLSQQQLDLKQCSPLSPFEDELGIIRVGGRLQFAPAPANLKHPILLPRDCQLSRLIVTEIHERHYHSGPSLTLSILRGEYWIPRALKLIRSVIAHCVQCRIQRARPLHPIMAPLPKERFSQNRAFTHVGLDYAGPFSIKQGNLRKSPVGKAYLCLFICLSTKAVHLEAVSSLTTEAFLAALDRFISRRGLPSLLWSDRGTNFIGASRFIKDVYKFMNQSEDSLVAWLAPKNVTWRFNPPHAPHFGGIWEAGVKSVKNLLPRTVGTQSHTFEELTTVFTRIEHMLNSRPLCALTEDPENCDFLTPAHFIIGESLTALPEPLGGTSCKPLKNRWEAVQARVKQVWDRWNQEYLHSLQQRNKWRKQTPHLCVGQLVILTERRNMIGQWPVGRVTEVHPGEDGVVRSASVRAPSGKIYLRPTVSLVPLFPPNDQLHPR